MQDHDKTPAQLIEELTQLRQRVAELESCLEQSVDPQPNTDPNLVHEEGDRQILEHAVIGFFQTTPDGRYMTVNPAMAKMLGYESCEDMLINVTNIDQQIYVDPSQREKFKELVHQHGSVAEFEHQVYCKNGSVIWVSENTRAVYDSAGSLLYYEGMTVDITRRKRAEEALKCIRNELEQIVEERTAALQDSNDQLLAEIAERQQAELALKKAHDQLRAILDAVPGIVSWIGSDLRYLGVNRHLAKAYDLPPEAFVGKDIGFLDSSPDFRQFVSDFFAGASADAFREVSACVKGQFRKYLIVAQKYDQDQAAFTVGIDITARHQAELNLREAEAKYRAIYENAAEGIFQTTPDGKYLSANAALARIYGYGSPDELMTSLTDIGHQLYVHPRRRAEFIDQLRTHGSVVRFESQVYRRDGSQMWISENARVVYAPDGQASYYEGTVEDITELKRAQEALQKAKAELESRVEERTAALREINERLVQEITERQRIEAALRASESELRALFAAMTDVIAVFDSAGRYLKIVSTNSEFLYNPAMERIGKTVYDILPPEQATLFAIHIQRALNTGKTLYLEYSLPISDHVERSPHASQEEQDAWFNASVSPMPDSRVLWVARNVTERRRAEQALREAEEKYRSIFENAAEGIFQTTPDGRCLSANPALVRMYGYDSAEDMMTAIANMGDLYVEPSRREEFIHILEDQGAIAQFESQAYRKDGSKIWILENARVVRDSENRILYYEGTVADITQRKQAEAALRESEAKEREKSQQLEQAIRELQQTQAQLVQSEKLSSLGQLMAGVAHEINNPVNFIYGNLAYARNYTRDMLELLRLYQKAVPKPPEEIHQQIDAIDLNFIMQDLPKLLGSMRLGAERIREIVRSLRNFARHDEAEVKVVDIHEGLDSTLMILQHRLKADAGHPAIQIVKDYQPIGKVRCYAGQLNQVFMNILSNAIDALRTMEARTHDPEQCASTITIRTRALPDNWVAVHIGDNGPGIDETTRKQIFDPFFTTKEVGQGTGLGLSISHQVVVERHQGRISVESEVGQGTEFVIEIPMTPPDEE
jgi:PAS domain S-box-containing protein